MYEGRLTKLIIDELFYAVPYYTSITKLLKGMGCIRQLKRGGGGSLSQWELVTSPTEEKFFALAETDPSTTKTTRNPARVTREEFERLEQRVRDLQNVAMEAREDARRALNRTAHSIEEQES